MISTRHAIHVALLLAFLLGAEHCYAQTARQWAEARRKMVEYEVTGLGVQSERVRSAMLATPPP